MHIKQFPFSFVLFRKEREKNYVSWAFKKTFFSSPRCLLLAAKMHSLSFFLLLFSSSPIASSASIGLSFVAKSPERTKISGLQKSCLSPVGGSEKNSFRTIY